MKMKRKTVLIAMIAAFALISCEYIAIGNPFISDEEASLTSAARTITFDKNSGLATGSMDDQVIPSGRTTELNSCDFEQHASRFVGWSTSASGSVKYEDGEAITMGDEDITLYAQWDVGIYTITFNKVSGSAAGSTAPMTLNYAEEATLTANGFSRAGYTFQGWDTDASADTVVYADEAAITMGAADMTLYAVWDAQTFTISFDGSGGSVGNATQAADTDSSVALNAGTCTYAGNTLLGWATSAGGSLRYSATETITMPSSNLSLYAVWIEDGKMAMVTVPGGTFTQIARDSNGNATGNSFDHTVSQFKLGQTELVYELWWRVRQWALDHDYTFQLSGREGNDGTVGGTPQTNEPVTTINWRDAIVWCNAYSELSGLDPVYYTDSGHTTPIRNSVYGDVDSNSLTAGNIDNPYVDWSGNGFRLPTQGEWIYAASYEDGLTWTSTDYAAGATADFSDAGATGAVAVYGVGQTSDVGQKTATDLVLYDMSGNVMEWVWDWYNNATWPGSAQTDFRGYSTSSNDTRYAHGGAYDFSSFWSQIGYRHIYGSSYAGGDHLGFRVARYDN